MTLDVASALSNVGEPIVVASFPRSGTHLAIDLLRRHVAECDTWKRFGEPTEHLYLSLDGLLRRPEQYEPQQVLAWIRRPARPIIKTHGLPTFEPWQQAHQPWVDWLRNCGRFIYVHRDGRAAVTSLYMGRQGMFASASDLTFSEFLRMDWAGMNIPQRWAAHVEQWLAVQGVLPLRMEQMLEQPGPVVEQLAGSLGLTVRFGKPLLPAPIRSRWHGRWVRLMRRRPQSTALVAGRYRRVASPPWPDLFSAEDRRYFHEQAGHMLIHLGMEQNDIWVQAASASHV